jgi:hypothetical protein
MLTIRTEDKLGFWEEALRRSLVLKRHRVRAQQPQQLQCKKKTLKRLNMGVQSTLDTAFISHTNQTLHQVKHNVCMWIIYNCNNASSEKQSLFVLPTLSTNATEPAMTRTPFFRFEIEPSRVNGSVLQTGSSKSAT